MYVLSNKSQTIKGRKKCVRKNWELLNANEEDYKKSYSAELIATLFYKNNFTRTIFYKNNFTRKIL